MYYTISFIVMCYGIFASIMAVINCNNLNKAAFLQILGIISIAISVLWVIVDINTVGALAIVAMPINLVFPILYIVGATRNKKAAA